ncbi:MAG: hypothetical protein IJS90_03940 [Clostridia bacterium]|nr:hypothetical protein [Clostridia bacterium]
MKEFIKQRRDKITFFTALAFFAAAIAFSGEIKDGAKEGMEICLGSIIPSLFPTLIISSFITEAGIPPGIRKALFFPIKKMTSISENAAECFIFGLTAGYPVGVKTAFALYKQKRLDINSARICALANISPGIVFCTAIVGKNMFSSSAAGTTMLFSVMLSNLLLAVILGRKKGSNETATKEDRPFDFPVALTGSVSSAFRSTAMVCAWITAFSAFLRPLKKLVRSPFLSVFAEVTSAAVFCASKKSLPLCAFSLGFGGLCLFFQLLPELTELKTGPLKYLLCRLFAGGAAYVFESVLLRFLPEEIAASASNAKSVRLSSSTPLGSLSLVLLCAVFMISLYNGSPELWAKTNSCHHRNNMIELLNEPGCKRNVKKTDRK